jgi:hypothetical protein
MADLDPQALYQASKLKGYKFVPNDKGTYDLIFPPNRDLGFEQQLRRNYYPVMGLVSREIPLKADRMPMKAATDATPAGQQRKTWVQRESGKLNDWLNSFVAPGKSLDPSYPAETGEMVKELLRGTVVPESLTGKATMLASLGFGPAEGLYNKIMSVLAPAATGYATAKLSGEMPGWQGATVGTITGLGTDIPPEINDLGKFLKRSKIYKVSDEARMNEVFDNIVGLPGVHENLKSGKKAWWHVFKQKPAQDEAGARIENARAAIANGVDASVPPAQRALDSYFQMTYGVPLGKVDRSGASKLDKRIIDAANTAHDDMTFLNNFADNFRNNLQNAAKLGKKAFQQGYHRDDVLKPGPEAYQAATDYYELQDTINSSLDKLEQLNQKYKLGLPDFKSLHNMANDQYKKFSAIRDMARVAQEAQSAGKPVQKTLMDHLQDNPESFEGRLGDQWHVINYLSARRGAEDIGPGGDFEHTDIPSLLKKIHIRASGAGGHGALFTSIESLRHPFGKFIGRSPVKYGDYGIPTQAVSRLLSTEASHLADPLVLLNKDTDDATK